MGGKDSQSRTQENTQIECSLHIGILLVKIGLFRACYGQIGSLRLIVFWAFFFYLCVSATMDLPSSSKIPEDKRIRRRILSLDGGGTRGYLSLLILEKLEEKLKQNLKDKGLLEEVTYYQIYFVKKN